MILAAVVFLTVLVGAFLQRVSGMGLGLIGGPVLMIAMGPVDGILVLNVLAAVNAAMSTLTVYKDVHWRNFAIISAVLVLGAVPGAWLIRAVSPDWLLIVAGALLLIALSVVTIGKRHVPQVSGTAPMALSGVVAGFMNTLAGIADPAITVYATAARWPQRMYAATLQPIFMVSGAISFGIKLVTGAADLSAVNPIVWPVGLVAMAVGIFLGVKVAPHVPRARAYQLALGLAVFGGVVALGRGLVGLIA